MLTALFSSFLGIVGAEIFFPDSQTRRNHLLSMVDQVMEEKKAASLGLTFESLCRFFSNKDASGLLGLPDTVTEVCLYFEFKAILFSKQWFDLLSFLG